MEQSKKKWANEILNAIEEKLSVVAKRNINKIPYTTIDGRYDDWSGDRIGWWTNGFWGGIMWQMYSLTDKEIYKEIAIDVENKLDAVIIDYRSMDHDSGFRWLPTAVADYKLTGNKRSYARARVVADNLAGRFNPAGNYIRAWNDDCTGQTAGWAIIDCMMNLPLLYWAYEDTKDYRYYKIATAHADTAIKYFIRDNGSVNHIVEFDPVTGEFIKSHGGQGYKEGSSWTRGQAWGLYGFALSYLHTNEKRYLDASKKIADYFISQMSDNGLIPIDFNQPEECIWEDSTAAAIASCGLLVLSELIAKDDDKWQDLSDKYEAAAIKLLETLTKNRCDLTTDKDNIVERCSAAYNDKEHEFAIIYGDYFYIEALCKLADKELFIW